MGFHCPICRAYIPNTKTTDNPEEWAKCFPENFVLEKHAHSSDKIFCEACLRESEEEDATHLCYNCNEKMCKNCTKYHNRGQLTRTHQVSLLSEITYADLVPDQINGEFCVHHQDIPITLFCQDHEEPCCTMCVSTSHRKCQRVESIEKAAKRTRQVFEQESFSLLVEDLEIIQHKLLDAKYDQEKLVAQIEITADTISTEHENAFDEVIKHLQFLKNQYLTNMAIGLKKSKEKITKNIYTLLDGFQCASYCSKGIEESIKAENATELAVKYHEAKKCFHRLKHVEFSLMNVRIEKQNPEIFQKVTSVHSFSDVRFVETTRNVKTHLEKMHLRLVSDVVLREKILRDGTFLSQGQFIISTANHKSKCEKFGQCVIYDKCGKYLRTISTLSDPFGILYGVLDIIIVFPSTKYLQAGSSHSIFSFGSKPIKLPNEPYCITQLLHYLYVACNDKIIKINHFGRQFATFDTGPSVKHITSTSSNIIYSNRRTNEVVAIDGQGTTVWRYSSPGLLSPCGLSVDGDDNIYVAGKESDNVHVLTRDGHFVRVFEDITRPDFMKVDKERKMCFVGSMRKYIKVYEML